MISMEPLKPQWERTKTWFASAHQDLGEKTEANFAFRKHTDLYVYIRDDPSYYTNWHTDESWQGNLRRHDNLPLHGVLSYGVEGLAESIHSTNLGIHSRERGSGYVFYDLRSVRRYSLSAGIREEVYGAHSGRDQPFAQWRGVVVGPVQTAGVGQPRLPASELHRSLLRFAIDRWKPQSQARERDQLRSRRGRVSEDRTCMPRSRLSIAMTRT